MLTKAINFKYENEVMENSRENNILTAAYYGDTAQLRRAIDESPGSINVRDSFTGATALIIAAGVGNYSCAEILAATEGVDLLAKDYDGQDALDRAFILGHSALCEMLADRIWPESLWDIDPEDDQPSNVVSLGPV